MAETGTQVASIDVVAIPTPLHELLMPVILRHCCLPLFLVLTLPLTVVGQRPFATSRDSISQAAAKLLNSGRGNEARILLQQHVRGNPSREQRAVYRLEVGNSYLYDGLYNEAFRIYDALLAGGDLNGVDSLQSWAHRGMGLAEAFAGRETRGATHLAQALALGGDSRFALGDTLEMLIITGQHDAAAKVLDRMASRDDEASQQYVPAFRGLNLMMAGHCTPALAAIAKAPRQDRPVPLAVRGRCAAKHGQKAESLVLRDSVLGHPTPDPFAWTMIIARDAARKIR